MGSTVFKWISVRLRKILANTIFSASSEKPYVKLKVGARSRTPLLSKLLKDRRPWCGPGLQSLIVKWGCGTTSVGYSSNKFWTFIGLYPYNGENWVEIYNETEQERNQVPRRPLQMPSWHQSECQRFFPKRLNLTSRFSVPFLFYLIVPFIYSLSLAVTSRPDPSSLMVTTAVWFILTWPRMILSASLFPISCVISLFSGLAPNLGS